MRYFIRQQKRFVSGPFPVNQILQWVRAGKVREEMEFSEDRREWMLGLEMVDLFPARRRAARPVQPRWTYRGRECA